MEIHYFTRADLVSFGNYLLSEERKKSILEHPAITNNPNFNEEERANALKTVNHADVENWFSQQTITLGE